MHRWQHVVVVDKGTPGLLPWSVEMSVSLNTKNDVHAGSAGGDGGGAGGEGEASIVASDRISIFPP